MRIASISFSVPSAHRFVEAAPIILRVTAVALAALAFCAASKAYLYAAIGTFILSCMADQMRNSLSADSSTARLDKPPGAAPTSPHPGTNGSCGATASRPLEPVEEGGDTSSSSGDDQGPPSPVGSNHDASGAQASLRSGPVAEERSVSPAKEVDAAAPAAASAGGPPTAPPLQEPEASAAAGPNPQRDTQSSVAPATSVVPPPPPVRESAAPAPAGTNPVAAMHEELLARIASRNAAKLANGDPSVPKVAPAEKQPKVGSLLRRPQAAKEGDHTSALKAAVAARYVAGPPTPPNPRASADASATAQPLPSVVEEPPKKADADAAGSSGSFIPLAPPIPVTDAAGNSGSSIPQAPPVSVTVAAPRSAAPAIVPLKERPPKKVGTGAAAAAGPAAFGMDHKSLQAALQGLRKRTDGPQMKRNNSSSHLQRDGQPEPTKASPSKLKPLDLPTKGATAAPSEQEPRRKLDFSPDETVAAAPAAPSRSAAAASKPTKPARAPDEDGLSSPSESSEEEVGSSPLTAPPDAPFDFRRTIALRRGSIAGRRVPPASASKSTGVLVNQLRKPEAHVGDRSALVPPDLETRRVRHVRLNTRLLGTAAAALRKTKRTTAAAPPDALQTPEAKPPAAQVGSGASDWSSGSREAPQPASQQRDTEELQAAARALATKISGPAASEKMPDDSHQ